MTRKKYPSDYRRWFKVQIDILDDPKLDSCSADVFRFYFRLLAMLKRINSTDGCITLGRRALGACAGRDQLRHSLRVASAGAEAGLYAMRLDGEQALITVSKWAERQELTPKQLQAGSENTPDSRVEQSKSRVRAEQPPQTPPPAARSANANPPDKIAPAWAEARAVFAAYGRNFAAKVGSRAPRLRRLLKDHGDRLTPHLDAIHGFRYANRARSEEWLEGYTRPDTVWRASAVEKNLDAYDLAIGKGLQPPFEPEADGGTDSLDKMATILRDMEERDGTPSQHESPEHELDTREASQATSTRDVVRNLSGRLGGSHSLKNL